jgi:transposase-like protein
VSEANSLQAVDVDAAEVVGEGTRVLCPKCGSDRPRRVERKGFFEKRIYPLFGYYPWRCPSCRAAFYLRKRYRRKSKKKEYMG